VEQVNKLARRRKTSFKATLNDVVRAGLAIERRQLRAYRTPARNMGLRPGVDLTHALGLVEAMEDAEIVRKLEMKK
jgi:hypothetical protein